jgi:hypothetical protein
MALHGNNHHEIDWEMRRSEVEVGSQGEKVKFKKGKLAQMSHFCHLTILYIWGKI